VFTQSEQAVFKHEHSGSTLCSNVNTLCSQSVQNTLCSQSVQTVFKREHSFYAFFCVFTMPFFAQCLCLRFYAALFSIQCPFCHCFDVFAASFVCARLFGRFGASPRPPYKFCLFFLFYLLSFVRFTHLLCVPHAIFVAVLTLFNSYGPRETWFVTLLVLGRTRS